MIPIYLWRFLDHAALRFALWTWLQGISGTVFQQADRLLLSAMLGAVALASYSVASQVGALVHAGLSAMFAVILPRLSRQMATDDSTSREQRFSHSWHRFVALNVIAVITLGLLLWFFGTELLYLWLGEAATAEVLRIYPMVLIAFLILSVNIAPHFVLLGAGRARYISLTNGVAALLAIAVLYPAVSLYGVDGAAFSRALYGIVLIVSYFGILRRFPTPG
jgi:O-antigen/teichoic acid export membrane protein